MVTEQISVDRICSIESWITPTFHKALSWADKSTNVSDFSFLYWVPASGFWDGEFLKENY